MVTEHMYILKMYGGPAVHGSPGFYILTIKKI
jgi:hypothetical protein